jgi:hypothetical protein|tara:strand:+ start:37 stop:264 length:228 start_codon:yes stop_codon:yes gene_type:complete
MRNIAKYLKKIDNSLETLVKNGDLIRDAKENLITINKLEDKLKKNKNIKIETLELIDQIITEIEKITSDSKDKSK